LQWHPGEREREKRTAGVPNTCNIEILTKFPFCMCCAWQEGMVDNIG
jgi:hypothetical protein